MLLCCWTRISRHLNFAIYVISHDWLSFNCCTIEMHRKELQSFVFVGDFVKIQIMSVVFPLVRSLFASVIACWFFLFASFLQLHKPFKILVRIFVWSYVNCDTFMYSYDFWDQVLRADNSSLAGDIRKEMKVNTIHFHIFAFIQPMTASSNPSYQA